MLAIFPLVIVSDPGLTTILSSGFSFDIVDCSPRNAFYGLCITVSEVPSHQIPSWKAVELGVGGGE